MSAASSTPEGRVLRDVRRHLRLNGWRTYRLQQGLGAHKGLPDLMAIRAGVVVALETKGPRGVQSDDQKRFEAEWTAAGGTYLLCKGVDDLALAGLIDCLVVL
jgi:hypothetical protein